MTDPIDYKGRAATWTAPNGLRFGVWITDQRAKFGRIDVLVQPQAGDSGTSAWVQLESLELEA